MVLVKVDVNQEKWVSNVPFFNVPKDHVSRFIVDFVDEFFESKWDEELDEKPGRPIFPRKTLLKILLYSAVERRSSTAEIGELLKYHQIYQFVADGLKPSPRTLRRFKSENEFLFEFILRSTLIKAQQDKITDFDHVAFDGTIAKANNSPYNIIKLKEIELLLDLLNKSHAEIKEYLDDKNNEKLRRSAYKLLTNKKQPLKEKVNLLTHLKKILKESGQTSVGLNCSDARWMLNKKNRKELSFNIQSAVDNRSGLIIVLNAVQDPTDHYQLISQLKNVKRVIGKYPDKISADYGYKTYESLKFLKDEKIDRYISNQKQTRENKGKKPANPYHKDYFTYDEEKDVYICPENQTLHYQRSYTHKKRQKRLYYTNKCKNCLVKEKCTKSNYRIISDYGDDLEKDMANKMNSKEGKKEYKKRMSTVEPVFGTLKTQNHLNQIQQEELEDIQAELNLIAAAYNLKRIYNIKKGDKKSWEEDYQKFIKEIEKKFPNVNLTTKIVNQKEE